MGNAIDETEKHNGGKEKMTQNKRMDALIKEQQKTNELLSLILHRVQAIDDTIRMERRRRQFLRKSQGGKGVEKEEIEEEKKEKE